VANDSASSMSNMTAITPGTGAPQRHVGLPVRDTTSGTVITAEIPAVRAGPSYGVLLPDGSVWYPGSRKRLPAPLFLRVAVWILAFAVFFAAAGDFIVRFHPSWVAPLRHMVPAQTVAAGGKAASSSGTKSVKNHGGGSTSAITLMSPQPSGLPNLTGYTVNEPAFTVRVTAGSNRAWVSGQAYVDGRGSGNLAAQTLAPGSALALWTTSDILVEIGANGTTIRLYSRRRVIATVPTPVGCPCYLLLEPTRP